MAPLDTWELGLKHKRGPKNVVFPGAPGCRHGWGWEAIRVTCVEATCRVQKGLGDNDTRVTNHPSFLRAVPILAMKATTNQDCK